MNGQANTLKFNAFEGISDSCSIDTKKEAEENEKQLVKYEADIRNHISIEQQL